MRVAGIVAALLLGLAAGVLPALAEDRTVTASNFVFTPKTVTVTAGEKVTFKNGAGNHNVVFEDGTAQPAQPSTAMWSFERTFDTAGTFTYYCKPHGTAAGDGMAGKVVVEAAAATTGTTTTTSSTTTPAPGQAAGESAAPGGAAAGDQQDGAAPGLWGRLVRPSSCARDGGPCPSQGVALRLGSNEAVRVEGELERLGARRAAVGLVRLRLPAGRSTVRFRGTSAGPLRPGRFQLTLTAVDAAGNRSAPLQFRVRLI